MRLLKQDKRRRGETIGKLLRCLDDMKDQGKLDETKVTDGRLLLAATVNTRGWSMEDRIYAAVEAMETERGKAQNQLRTFSRNLPVDGEATNLLPTCWQLVVVNCNGIWETTRHNRHNVTEMLWTGYGETGVMDFGPNTALC